MQQTPQNKKKDGMNWIGTLFFIVLIFGQPIAQFISRLTGGVVNPSIVVPLLLGTLALAAIASFVIRGLNSIAEQEQSHRPTPPPTPPPTSKPRPKPSNFSSKSPYNKSTYTSSFPSSSDLRKMSSRSGIGSQKLPGPPKFEPIIDPKVLVSGIIGAALLGFLLFGYYFMVNLNLTP